MNGTVLNISRFCTDDGPGIRTTVFLKGCPLRCLWCHNPESQKKQIEIMYNRQKCISCGQCAEICTVGCHSTTPAHTFDRTNCVNCLNCARLCPTNALELYGKEMSANEVFTEIKKDISYYAVSGGGVTISGGEPLFQPEFTAELIKLCKSCGLHTAIETSGFSDKNSLMSVIKHCDLILFDIKETDEELHKRYTGVSLRPILQNLKIIDENEIPFIIRAPIIPTLNDREAHFSALKHLRAMKSCQGIQIMPYHSLGAYKYELLGRHYPCKNIKEPEGNTTALWKSLL